MNLMCPARLILLPGGTVLEPGPHRIALVYASPAEAETARLAAEELGTGVRVVPELQEAAGESEADAVRRSEAALNGIADLHRGETVVVQVSGLSLGMRLGEDPVELEHDGSGWTVVPDPNAVTLATYEQAAERFRDTLRPRPSWFVELVSSHLQPGATVLELGSGTGQDALELEKLGLRVRRTDGAAAFVEMMRADGHQAEQLNLLTDDFGGPYDLVFADAVFLHFSPSQLRRILRKAARAAGQLAFTLREGEGEMWSTRHLELPRHFTLWQEAPLRRLLTETGWTVTVLTRGRSQVGAWLFVVATTSSPAAG